MSTVTEVKATKEIKPLKEETFTLSAALRKDMTIDAATGVITIAADAYEKNMPPTITKDQAIEFQKYNTNILAAATHAMGTLSMDTMSKKKTLDQTEMDMPMIGKDSISFVFKKQDEVSAGTGPDAGKKIVYGQTRSKINLHASGNRGELTKVKDHLAIAATALFS